MAFALSIYALLASQQLIACTEADGLQKLEWVGSTCTDTASIQEHCSDQFLNLGNAQSPNAHQLCLAVFACLLGLFLWTRIKIYFGPNTPHLSFILIQLHHIRSVRLLC